MTTLDHLHDGSLYLPTDPEILAEQARALERLYDYNQTRPFEEARRQVLLREMLEEVGEGCHIEPPFHANWGGKFMHLGKNVYINFGFSAVDDTHIDIGDQTMIGPNVLIATAGHPIWPEYRGEEPYQYNVPVKIGTNCWIGGNVTILPGIIIGNHSVIGAGSVVTKNIPENVVAAGNPCRVIRPIGEQDRLFYDHHRKVNI